jgi:hypothetical protein
VWDHIKNGGEHGAENFDLEWVGALPGMRESRRLTGDYIFNECDIWAARSFEDAVCHGGWSVDFHTPGGVLDKDLLPSATWVVPGTYTIPYRSFYSKNINNLFMAGRNLSATRLGLASTRIIGTCAVCGQAMGTAAALCVQKSISPRNLLKHIDELQQTLLKDDCFIPWVKNHDEKDMALKAEISATKPYIVVLIAVLLFTAMLFFVPLYNVIFSALSVLISVVVTLYTTLLVGPSVYGTFLDIKQARFDATLSRNDTVNKVIKKKVAKAKKASK